MYLKNKKIILSLLLVGVPIQPERSEIIEVEASKKLPVASAEIVEEDDYYDEENDPGEESIEVFTEEFEESGKNKQKKLLSLEEIEESDEDDDDDSDEDTV